MSPPTQYRFYGRRFYRSKDPTNSIRVLKEKAVKENNTKKHKENTNYTYALHTHTKQHTNTAYTNKHSKSPSLQLYGVTRRRLPQRAGLPGLNGGGATAAVLPKQIRVTVMLYE